MSVHSLKITIEDIEYTSPPKKGKGSAKKNKGKKPAKTAKAAKPSKAPKSGVSGKKGRKQGKTTKGKDKSSKRAAVVGVPTSKKDKLVDIGMMRPHNFISVTTPMLTKIYNLFQIDNTNKFEMDDEPHHVSAIMKLILTTTQTNELGDDWSIILWNITQHEDMLPEGCTVTFTRTFERKDNDLTRKRISRRRKLAILSSDSEENVKRQSIATSHDISLIRAIDAGDSVVAFGAEAIVTAPTEQLLEIAVEAVKNYLMSNDETRGLKYELDINKQTRPFITYGANESSGNKDVIFDMTSVDAGKAAMFVDSGGDRTEGSEYLGVSVGKLIRSHAAYNLKNQTSLYVGNDTTNKTATLGGTLNEPSQIYLSKAVSRAYLLTGKSVTHFVADDDAYAKHLMTMPLNANRKCVADVAKGLSNMLEPIDGGDGGYTDERVLSRFPTHINNLITLLSQFRNVSSVSVNDDFANIARDILIDFYVTHKYWSYDARNNLDDLRFIGVEHNQYKKLSDFGKYVSQRKYNNKDKTFEDALIELDTIINKNILPTIPALDTTTDDVIDKLVASQYRVVDLTGMSSGATGNTSNPAMNVMMISYLNIILPSMKNGDAVFIHGVSRLSSIAPIIKDMIDSSGLNLDVVYTEKNQIATLDMIEATKDVVGDGANAESHAMTLDFVMVDLYNNRSDRLVKEFGMDANWVSTLTQNEGSYFIKTERGLDYIYLDRIL